MKKKTRLFSAATLSHRNPYWEFDVEFPHAARMCGHCVVLSCVAVLQYNPGDMLWQPVTYLQCSLPQN